MLTERTKRKIQDLENRGFNSSQIARTLRISRPTVLKYVGEATPPKESSDKNPTSGTHTPLTFDDLFEMDRCEKCQTRYPAPKFLPSWKCPYCKTGYSWTEPCFKP